MSLYVSSSVDNDAIASAMAADLEEASLILASFAKQINGGDVEELGEYLGQDLYVHDPKAKERAREALTRLIDACNKALEADK